MSPRGASAFSPLRYLHTHYQKHTLHTYTPINIRHPSGSIDIATPSRIGNHNILKPPYRSHVRSQNKRTYSYISGPTGGTPPPKTPTLPPRLQKYAAQLKNAPVSHVTAFLILHELTAIVPLAGLWWGIHSFGRVEVREVSGEGRGVGGGNGEEGVMGRVRGVWDGWVSSGAERFGRYVEKKGWTKGMEAAEAARITMELGTAWAVVKVLLPVRIVGSLWLTPWFARVVVGRVGGWVGKLRGGMGK